MKKVYDKAKSPDTDDKIHYAAAPMTAPQTLCGYCDVMDSEFVYTTQRVNCETCKTIVAYVRGKSC